MGLRGLNWSVTIAQLMAAAIMTLLRVVVRRDLVLDEVQREELPKGYELDWTAKRLTDCATWKMVTWGPMVILDHQLLPEGHASRVIDARCRLGDLSGWEGRWKVKVNPIFAAIENAMNFLCTCDKVDIANLSTENVFSWKLVVEVAEVETDATSLDSATREDEDTTAEDTAQGNKTQQKLETVELSISRKQLSEGRGWGSWQMNDFNKTKIEAILGQWMLIWRYSWTASAALLSALTGEETSNLVNARDCDGQTALHYAVRKGRIEVMYLLLQNGANIRVVDNNGLTPLDFAVENAVIKLEHIKTVNPEGTKYFRSKLLHHAIINGQGDVVTTLLALGIDVEIPDDAGFTPLHTAVLHNRKGMTGLLLTSGADVHRRCPDGCTALHHAVTKECDIIVRILLEQGAEIDPTSKFKETPLHLAAMTGQETTCSSLLATGANIEALDDSEKTPLHYAVKKGHKNLVLDLLERGANIEVIDSSQKTPLDHAIRDRLEDIARILVQKGASTETLNNVKDTPIHCAIQEGHEHIVCLLLVSGANIEATNDSGETPLHQAVRTGNHDIVGMVLDLRANIEATNSSTETPLHCALREDQRSIARMIIGRGANIEAINDDGETPLHHAIRLGHITMARMFVQ
jgi:ankyrin repeat protein